MNDAEVALDFVSETARKMLVSSLSLTPFHPRGGLIMSVYSSTSGIVLSQSLRLGNFYKRICCSTKSSKDDQVPDSNPRKSLSSRIKKNSGDHQPKGQLKKDEDSKDVMPEILPKKPRRGRKSEAAAVEDFVRNSLEKAIASIREQESDKIVDTSNILKERVDDASGHNDNGIENNDSGKDSSGEKSMVVEEEDSNWPLDADVGLGIRASEYFELHPIKNVVGEDGVEIDWEGEIDDCLVNEITCLEWERFAFHPSPLIVLVFERYNRASENWKVLKELEEAAKVYWRAKDRLPPRTIKIDINIERDLAYALKVKECPQILFLKGNRILYREKEFRSADELVQMIAHFYYKAKKPSCIKDVVKSTR